MQKSKVQDTITLRVERSTLRSGHKTKLIRGIGAVAAAQRRLLPTEAQRKEDYETQHTAAQRALVKEEVAERLREARHPAKDANFSYVARGLHSVVRLFESPERLADLSERHSGIKITAQDTAESLTGTNPTELDELKLTTTKHAFAALNDRRSAAAQLPEGKTRDMAIVDAYMGTAFPFTLWDYSVGSDWEPIHQAFGIDDEQAGVDSEVLRSQVAADVVPAWVRLAADNSWRSDGRQFNTNGCNFTTLMVYTGVNPNQFDIPEFDKQHIRAFQNLSAPPDQASPPLE